MLFAPWASENFKKHKPDMRRQTFNELIDVGSPDKIKIEAPAIDLNKEEIVKLGVEVDAPMQLSYSCYKGGDKHCGVCESCMRRKRAFKNIGVKDLSEYEI